MPRPGVALRARMIRFNEAGILHPGMLVPPIADRALAPGFNEAGILHPGMRRT